MVPSHPVILRPYRTSDTHTLIDLFRTTVRTVNRKDYSAEEVAVWAPDDIDPEVWQRRMLDHRTWVAEIRGEAAGFAELTEDGAIHMLYVGAGFQRQGVAGTLLDALEAHARTHHMPRLLTYASLTARGFFARSGYRHVRRNRIRFGDLELENSVMEKRLLADPNSTD